MPYIITAGYRPPGPGASLEATFRCAVATLEEARKAAARKIMEQDSPFGHYDERMAMAVERVTRETSEAGSTVGPLPDGTVIEVERVDEQELWSRLGEPEGYREGDVGELIAAYNAAQEPSRV